KPLFRMTLVCLFTVLLSGAALAQPAQPAQPDLYVSVSYMKILPGQEDAYRAYLNTTVKKLYQELMAANPSFLSWSSAKAMYQGTEHGLDFDYVGASIYSGPPPEPGATLDAIYMKATGMSQADLAKKVATMRTVVGTELLRYRAGVRIPGVLKEGDFRVVARIKIKPNMGDEYVDLAQTVTQPIMAERIANGELKSWSLWSRVFPSGVAISYDAFTVQYFKDLASAVKGLDATKGVQAFLKVHPGRNYATYVNNARDYSDMQQRLVMQVVAMVERAK
ncbi:MAG: hypothetical protein NTY02_09060, partial [Acidobacteria bacterium]|nr:hypothetical protein [Acidobacteriota bacterium]